ncbi:MAG TPA: phosphatidate cytidylyltransferase, partial [Burkholderiales bacterium]|nr:phosphatidate cytidylyltransferase [Burkholderiales bacterium]
GGRVQSPYVRGLAGWAVLVPAWLALLRLQAQPAVLLALLGIVWVADSSAYLAGKTWGKHSLAPSISPAKTWEGVVGAAVGVAVYYVLVGYLAPEWRWWRSWSGAVLVSGVVVLCVVGDLFESWIKRLAGAKDSGSLLPGHGGILDRIDSVTSSMPFAALLLLYIR